MTDKVKKIREEVVRMHNLLPVMDGDNISVNYADRICTTLEMYIDSLQKEPVSEDLEEASKEWLRQQLDKSYANYGEGKMMKLTHFDGYAMLDAIEYGMMLQKQQMMSKAIVRKVKVDAGGYPYIDTTELYDYNKDIPLAKEGDKVKVIVIKED